MINFCKYFLTKERHFIYHQNVIILELFSDFSIVTDTHDYSIILWFTRNSIAFALAFFLTLIKRPLWMVMPSINAVATPDGAKKRMLWALPYASMTCWIALTTCVLLVPPGPVSKRERYFLYFGSVGLLIPLFWSSMSLKNESAMIQKAILCFWFSVSSSIILLRSSSLVSRGISSAWTFLKKQSH